MELKRLHFIGIKGVGMSALATVAKGLGYQVTGSDVAEEFITDVSLREVGISVQEGFAADHISPEIDLVIVGAAFGSDNPEVKRAQELNLTIWTYSQLLGELAKTKKTVAVAGTHGKTTTTSLLAYLLYNADLDPSWVIGTAHIAGLPGHGHAGGGDLFVTEADDYKRSPTDATPKFLDLTPHAAIVTSIEHDHPDMYPTLADCIEAFHQFMKKVTGFLVVNGDDANIQGLIDCLPNKKFITYGFSPSCDYQIEVPQGHQPASHFVLRHDNRNLGPFHLQLPGKHNLYNAAAAVVMAHELGVPVEKIQATLPGFTAVERRYQVIGERDNILVIDDYAHHPTAIHYTLQTAKEEYPDRPLWCVFQPHTYSRTKALLTEFGQAFNWADEVLITDIFASARETDATIDAQDLVKEIQLHRPARYVPKSELLDYLRHHVPSGAILVTMGAGDIYKIGQRFISSS